MRAVHVCLLLLTACTPLEDPDELPPSRPDAGDDAAIDASRTDAGQCKPTADACTIDTECCSGSCNTVSNTCDCLVLTPDERSALDSTFTEAGYTTPTAVCPLDPWEQELPTATIPDLSLALTPVRGMALMSVASGTLRLDFPTGSPVDGTTVPVDPSAVLARGVVRDPTNAERLVSLEIRDASNSSEVRLMTATATTFSVSRLISTTFEAGSRVPFGRAAISAEGSPESSAVHYAWLEGNAASFNIRATSDGIEFREMGLSSRPSTHEAWVIGTSGPYVLVQNGTTLALWNARDPGTRPITVPGGLTHPSSIGFVRATATGAGDTASPTRVFVPSAGGDGALLEYTCTPTCGGDAIDHGPFREMLAAVPFLGGSETVLAGVNTSVPGATLAFPGFAVTLPNADSLMMSGRYVDVAVDGTDSGEDHIVVVGMLIQAGGIWTAWIGGVRFVGAHSM